MKPTTTAPRAASLPPSVTWAVLEPLTKPPPWIHTSTGSFLPAAAAGAQMLRYKQSSFSGWLEAVLSQDMRFCMQSLPYWVASRTPLQAAGAAGARQRSAPTGGAA